MAARSAWSTQGNYTLPTCAPCRSSKRWNENIHQLTNRTCQCCPIAPTVSASRPCSGQAAAGPPTYEHLMAPRRDGRSDRGEPDVSGARLRPRGQGPRHALSAHRDWQIGQRRTSALTGSSTNSCDAPRLNHLVNRVVDLRVPAQRGSRNQLCRTEGNSDRRNGRRGPAAAAVSPGGFACAAAPGGIVLHIAARSRLPVQTEYRPRRACLP
jgi:hypothetical protein